MTNLDRLDGTDLLIHGFADFVRMWYAKLEENGVIPKGSINSAGAYHSPAPIPEDLQVFYDLIAQGHDIDDGKFVNLRTTMITMEQRQFVIFGPSGAFGVFDKGSSEFGFVRHTGGSFQNIDRSLSHYLIWRGLTNIISGYRGLRSPIDDPASDEWVETIMEQSSPIWSRDHRQAFYWHRDGFLVCNWTNIRSKTCLNLAFTNTSQEKEWEKKTDWSAFPKQERPVENRFDDR